MKIIFAIFTLLILQIIIIFTLLDIRKNFGRSYIIPNDKIELNAIVGIGVRPYSIKLGAKLDSYAISGVTSTPIWTYVFYYDDIQKPSKSTILRFEVVDQFGEKVNVDRAPEIIPDQIITDNDGFNTVPIALQTHGLEGLYRIKATYSDKMSATITYSPLIHVTK